MVIDLHCHPALKLYLYEDSLFSQKLQDGHNPSRGINFIRPQVDLPNMKLGGVKAAIAAHYIPEIGLRRESSFIDGAAGIMNLFWKNLADRIEKAGAEQELFKQVLESIRIFEKKIESAQEENENVSLAYSYAEFERLLFEGRTVFLHSIEGAHCLGRNLPSKTSNSSQPEDYLKNLEILFDKGACMMTLGHFYDNDLVSPSEGLPPSQRIILNKHVEKDLTKGLTIIGEEVIRRMIEKGMLIDLVHSTPVARKRIFDINDEYGFNKRPLVFSHSGVQELFSNKKYPVDKYYSPDQEEILRIKDCNGVIGLIFMNYWLSGRDEKFLVYEPGMEYLFNTVDYIYKITGSYDNIAIGSDFDAVNNPSDDIFNHSFLPRFQDYLRKKGILGKEVEKIMSENARRLLKEGWGR